ncbi:protein S100-A16-like isoform X2 [Ahaetulla prasina]|uniref:protein S100-A16-like isoform X2 n=1 Tax=Ahaetulla prasina TaxID=499056 RepID=UPI0026492ED5|nr:protein S100-A16-like isoform X2 [Ahaetulla prasina]
MEDKECQEPWGALEAKGSGMETGETPKLESAIQTVVDYYNIYSSKEFLLFGKVGIRKSNFKKMLERDLSHILTNTDNKEEVEKLFKDLDRDGDGVIDFDKYWDLIGNIAKPIARDKQ